MARYQICSVCVMDTSDPDITFDRTGQCNHCTAAQQRLAQRPSNPSRSAQLRKFVAHMRRDGMGKEFDCVVGLSGGCDSSYLVFKVLELGLRPLLVHFDSGWNSELAVQNIERIVVGLDLDLHTVVCDWPDMRDLTRSYFRARVVNVDVPQDHAFIAVLQKVAKEEGLHYWVTGHDYFGSESILPIAWRGYTSQDWHNIQAIHKAMGGKPLRHYPHYTLADYMVTMRFVHRIRPVNLFSFIDYRKSEAKAFLEAEIGWRDYTGKHNESIFTRFIQGYYQPTHLGFDKRRAHLASLVATGQQTRESALAELSQPFYSATALKDDMQFVLKKLNFSDTEWSEIVSRRVQDATQFPNHAHLLSAYHRSYKLASRTRQVARRTASRINAVRGERGGTSSMS